MLKLSYIDACARFHIDAWSPEAPGKLNKLADAGLIKKIAGTKQAIAKVQEAGFPVEAAFSWVCAEVSSEISQERAASSSFRCERSML